MSWVCRLSDDALDDLRGMPKAIRARVARVLDQMESDPLQGDVKALRGKEWKGVFRRRIGGYRILFGLNHGRGEVIVYRILIRSGNTYD